MNQVGRYQIQQELGRGAMGVVYRALDPAIGRTVAIKTIRLAELTDPEERRGMLDRLFREAQAAGVLSHPNIVTIYDVFEEDDLACVCMEYVHGVSLDQMLRKGLAPAGELLLHFLRQIAEALDYAHRKGIVHRDIKPANILISESAAGVESLAKVTDFGVARFVSHEMTHNGTIFGTPSYMSPEQIQGTPVEGRSDQFSLGVVVYELLAGEKPFRVDNLPALVYAICKQEPALANEVNPALSASAGKVLQRALMKDPQQRFASCGEFVGALSIALGEGVFQSVADSTPVTRAISGIGAAVSTAAVAEASRTAPIISIPDPPPAPPPTSYELPTRVRRRREEDDFDSDQPPRRRSSGFKKFAVILAMCLAICGAIAFIVMSNSGPPVPVQVLDTRSGPVTPPPEGMDLTSRSKGTSSRSTGTGAQSVLNGRARELPVPSSRSLSKVPASTPAAIPSVLESSHLSDVELLTQPPGAKMVVDGRADLTCNSPCTLSLVGGRHTVMAELAGYNIGRRIFTLPSDASLFVNLGKSMGVVLVTSPVAGCTVLVDGRSSGRTPATLHLTAGSHRIAVVGRSSRHEETVQVDTDGFDVERFLCQ